MLSVKRQTCELFSNSLSPPFLHMYLLPYPSPSLCPSINFSDLLSILYLYFPSFHSFLTFPSFFPPLLHYFLHPLIPSFLQPFIWLSILLTPICTYLLPSISSVCLSHSLTHYFLPFLGFPSLHFFTLPSNNLSLIHTSMKSIHFSSLLLLT